MVAASQRLGGGFLVFRDDVGRLVDAQGAWSSAGGPVVFLVLHIR